MASRMRKATGDFRPVRTEERPVDANGFCEECHKVATAWGDLLERQRQNMGQPEGLTKEEAAVLLKRIELGGPVPEFGLLRPAVAKLRALLPDAQEEG